MTYSHQTGFGTTETSLFFRWLALVQEKKDGLAFLTDIHNVNVHVLDLGAEDFARQKKTLFVGPSHTIPTERIGSQHPHRAALLRLKRIEAIPGTQIEKRLARQVLRQAEPFELAA